MDEQKPIVTLDRQEVRLCADLALNRWLMKWDSTDRQNYTDKNKLEPEIVANIRTIVAEYAVAKFYRLPQVLPFYPNEEHSYRYAFPDVLPNFEVRTVRTYDAVPLFTKDNRAGLVIIGTKVLDDNFYRKVEIWGGIQVQDAYKSEWLSQKEGFWRIPKNAFKINKSK